MGKSVSQSICFQLHELAQTAVLSVFQLKPPFLYSRLLYVLKQQAAPQPNTKNSQLDQRHSACSPSRARNISGGDKQ